MTTTPGRGHLAPGRSVDLPFSAPGTPSNSPSTVGFIGLGNIGFAMAQNVANHHAIQKPGNLSLIVWNRSPEKSTRFVEQVDEQQAANGGILHVQIAKTVEELAIESDIIIVSLSSDTAVLEVMSKIFEGLKEAKAKLRIIVDTSTVYPSTSGKVDELFSKDALTRFVAAPVFGAPQAAREAKLIICMAGDYSTKKKVAYLLVPAAGRKVIDLGGNVEKALAFKLLGNSYIAGSLELLAETHTLAQKIAVGSQQFHELLEELFPAPPVLGYSKRMLEDNFDGTSGFNIDGGIKDVHHMQRLAAQVNCPIPIIDVAHQHLLTARALNANQPSYQTRENMDWSGIVSASRMAAGLDPFDSGKHKIGPVLEPEVIE